DVRVWVEDDDGVEISQRHDRSDGQFKSTRNFLRDLLDGPGSDDKTLRLRLLENYSNYVGEAELHFRMKDGDDFDEEIEDDIDFLEGAGERDRDITCAQEWDCGQFSACRNGVQTRSCTRSDNCNARIRAGQVDRVIPVSKPAERQSCAETENQFREEFDNTRVAPSDSSVAICSPNEKRCFGSQLQRCSFDGEEWQTIQTCPDQCDSFSLSCTEEDVSFSEPASKGLPDWLLPLVGVIVLLGIITALVVVMVQHKKKFGPAKQYVKSSRAKGLSDSTTRMRLISQGWDPDKVDKLMK
ncbi:TPA: hypothetical protein HA278_07965, partial [Candidatus Woesearchaeota archaeon]|nr:hypothetical protein [Candidatus Woesearchaeota archaeon]